VLIKDSVGSKSKTFLATPQQREYRFLKYHVKPKTDCVRVCVCAATEKEAILLHRTTNSKKKTIIICACHQQQQLITGIILGNAETVSLKSKQTFGDTRTNKVDVAIINFGV